MRRPLPAALNPEGSGGLPPDPSPSRRRSKPWPCDELRQLTASSYEQRDPELPRCVVAEPSGPLRTVVTMHTNFARFDGMRCEVRKYQRDVARLRDHRVRGVGAALADALAGMRVNVARHHPLLVGADIPELAVRQPFHVYAALQTIGVKVVEEDHPRDDARVTVAISQEEGSGLSLAVTAPTEFLHHRIPARSEDPKQRVALPKRPHSHLRSEPHARLPRRTSGRARNATPSLGCSEANSDGTPRSHGPRRHT